MATLPRVFPKRTENEINNPRAVCSGLLLCHSTGMLSTSAGLVPWFLRHLGDIPMVPVVLSASEDLFQQRSRCACFPCDGSLASWMCSKRSPRNRRQAVYGARAFRSKSGFCAHRTHLRNDASCLQGSAAAIVYSIQ